MDNDLKKVLISADDAVLKQIKTALQFFGRPNLQKQWKAAYVLLRYEPTYATFWTANHIPIPKGEHQLTVLIFPNFKCLRDIGLEVSNSKLVTEQVAEQVVEQPNQSNLNRSESLKGEVDAILNLAFEEADFNLPSTSGRVDTLLEDNIFTGLGDLPDTDPGNMARELLAQMARRKNAKKMAARRRAEAARSEPPPPTPIEAESSPPALVEETKQIVMAEMEQIVIEQSNDLVAKQRGEKRPAKHEVDFSENLIHKRIKNFPVASDALALKDAAVALSVSSSIFDRATFRAESDVVSIALAAQSAILAASKIADIGPRHYDVIEQIGLLKAEVESEKGKAKKALAELAKERARASVEEEKAKCFDQLRLAAEERVNASDDALKLAKEVNAKLEADLEELNKAKEIADSKISKAFEAGENTALEKHMDGIPKFENQGFKHGCLKALVAANVILEQPIPYELLEVEPLESDPEE
ncbi:unnamed protein product [Camellia sinensis]